MPVLIIRHQSERTAGHKASREHRYSELDLEIPLSIGRDPANRLMFSEAEEAVSRHHARIEKTGEGFRILDLNSANGLYRNGERVQQAADLQHGDTLQLGQGGPVLTVAFDPPPQTVEARPTRLIEVRPAAVPARPTVLHRQVEPPVVAGAVGRGTLLGLLKVERRRSSRTWQLVAGAVAALVLLGGWTAYDAIYVPAHLPQLVKADYDRSTVRIFTSWRLMERYTGRQIYHRQARGRDGEMLPAYVRLEDGSIEPLLTSDAGGEPVASKSQGSGFVIDGNGTIVTNRHVAAGWLAPYQLSFPGLLIEKNPRTGELQASRLESEPENLRHWIPARSQLVRGMQGVHDTGNVVGEVVEMHAFFPNSRVAFPLGAGPISPVADVATVHLTAGAGRLPVAPINDAYDSLQAGSRIVTLGYPAISEALLQQVSSTDIFSSNMKDRVEVTDASVTAGEVLKTVRSARGTDGDPLRAEGDYYETSLIATGAGNSGGPVFDASRKGIGIYTMGRWDGAGTRLAGVVPIRYALELLQPQNAMAARP